MWLKGMLRSSQSDAEFLPSLVIRIVSWRTKSHMVCRNLRDR